MASLEKGYDGRYRIVFCWLSERRFHSLGKMPEREARSCLDRLDESLRFVDRGPLEVPADADLGRFLVSRGKLNGRPVLEAPLRFGELGVHLVPVIADHHELAGPVGGDER
jgi:hypothetical protein